MADVVYLHVGAPKTGTTYLQDRLYLNRAALSQRGVHYPVGLNPDMFGAALDLIDMSWGGQRDAVRGEWDALAGRVRRASGRAIVSHEILAGARSGQVRKAMADLDGAEVHIVYSARDLARQIPAEWQENVKHRKAQPYAKFVAQVQGAARHKPKLWFWRAQSLPDVLSRWTQGLPPERVHLVTVPQTRAGDDVLWRRYCRAFGITPEWAPEDSDRRNTGIGVDETMMLRRLNRRLAAEGLESADYRAIVRELLVHQRLSAREGMDKVTLRPDLYDWADEVTTEWLEWVEGSGIDVIGDLQDLRPRRPEPGTTWLDPDVPRRGRINDATMDALVAMILELADRPDPDESPAVRLTRAARRLRGQ